MKIVMLASNDPAGMAITFTNTINRTTEHECRLITFGRVYNVAYETDLHLPDLNEDYGEVIEVLKQADVVHFHNLLDENWPIGPFAIREFTRGKQIVYHEHGHPYFLHNAEGMQKACADAGRRVLVSTPDLLKMWPGSVWMPNIVPIFDVGFLPAPGNQDGTGPIRVCQAPTRKWHKNTSEFLAVSDGLLARHSSLERVIIENRSYDECLRIKRRCQIVFDHMQGHFGISSLESFSQGVPVVAGVDTHNLRCVEEFAGGGKSPWVLASNADELRARLEELIENRSLRQQIGAESRRWMEQDFTADKVMSRLFEFYAK